jgi:heme/copper-type cytochrome/quinol oxidase subunit 3
MDQFTFCLFVQGIPFGCLTIMYAVLVIANWKTTGEIKAILPPDVLLKVFAVFMVASVIFSLAVLKIIQESTVSALLGAVATGVLGFNTLGRKSASE